MEKPVKSTPVIPTERIVALIETLRGENGCPWDRKQTPQTMARYLIEEVYELADAILADNAEAVCEEAGDVLFQLLFVIHLYNDAGQFGFTEVIDRIVEKMERRHPHVFGDLTAETPERVSRNWQKIKQAEKKGKDDQSVLGSIPQGLPALLRASIVSERAAKTGFDWDSLPAVMEKAMEEWQEFSSEIGRAADKANLHKAAEEFGDVLFTMVNVARFATIHPETALMRSIQKFEKRFAFMEQQAQSTGRTIDSLTFEEMHRLWDKAKGKLG